MQAKFTYVGIRVRDLDKSIEFYTKVLGMKVTGRGKIQKTKGETVGLQSTDDGFTLELNHYESDSQYFTGYVAGKVWITWASKWITLTKRSEKPMPWAIVQS